MSAENREHHTKTGSPTNPRVPGKLASLFITEASIICWNKTEARVLCFVAEMRRRERSHTNTLTAALRAASPRCAN